MKFNIGKKIAALFGGKKLSEEFFENFEDMLIEGDFGSRASYEIAELARERKPKTEEELARIIKEQISPLITQTELNPVKGKLNAYLVLGVNGVGKTTAIGKMAVRYKEQGYKVVMAAGDTFRAAAIDQLEIHSARTGCRIVRQNPGSDPGAVIFDALESAKSKGEDLVLCDTAGRMHNKENLLKELQKIDKIIRSKTEEGCYRKILVVDATTGQNIISQAKLFNEAVGLDAVILSKYDSSSKAGAIAQIGIPVAYIGTGEGYADFAQFDKDKFIEALLETK